jgi:LmbE family N-acetylglucosaminyl deacetylase
MNTDFKVKSKKAKGKNKALNFARRFFVFYFLLFTFYFSFAPLRETSAQVRPVYDYGATGLTQLLKKLNTTASVMHIGAHPDDEDSGLLSFLARGENARTAYLSLTRGDGGQNLIGSEQSEALGVIRTEELLQARRLDGAEQYFTRAFDYGFSKTLAEAKEKWDEKVILCDAVRAIRNFRPLVVISRFTGTPADGHGHHQFAGYIAPLAVKAAPDPGQCKDAGAPWQVLKFYVSQGFRDTKEPTLKINTGEYDPLLGRSYFEIAMEGRSQHKTQEQGILELKGDQFSGLNLIESNVSKVEKETSVFDGIDVSIVGISKALPAENSLIQKLIDIQKSAALVLKNYDQYSPQNVLQELVRGLNRIIAARALVKVLENSLDNRPETTQNYSASDKVLDQKQFEFSEAIKLASGLQIDALTDKETVVPGEDFGTTVKVFFPNAENVTVKEIKLNAPKDWMVARDLAPKDGNQNAFRRENANRTAYFNLKVAGGAKPTQPYWLENPRDANIYRWKPDPNQTLPFAAPLVSATVVIEVGGTEITLNQPVQFRFADDVRGEIRRDLNIVPPLTMSFDQKLLIVPSSEKAQTRRVVMSLANNSAKPLSGVAGLNIVGMERIDWKLLASSTTFNLKTKGEKTAITFDIAIPAKTKIGEYRIYAQAMVGEGLSGDEMNTLSYPHIQTHRFYTRAETRVEVLDLKTAAVKIGYIAGSGDRVADAIRQMNFDVEMLDENDLTSGDLSRFDVIVAGIRAAQVRPDFVANHQRLLDYVNKGGTLLVQYQPPSYQNLLPFPAAIGARVVDENAKVTILNAQSPIFNFPNKITDEDFKGWIQERNLNAFTTFDARYTPLLESHDINEPENKGGLVVAEIGEGKYIYCSYALFRQLPAGVPGAYRLFANLLSSPKEKINRD